jgi:hypothetical protein
VDEDAVHAAGAAFGIGGYGVQVGEGLGAAKEDDSVLEERPQLRRIAALMSGNDLVQRHDAPGSPAGKIQPSAAGRGAEATGQHAGKYRHARAAVTQLIVEAAHDAVVVQRQQCEPDASRPCRRDERRVDRSRSPAAVHGLCEHQRAGAFHRREALEQGQVVAGNDVVVAAIGQHQVQGNGGRAGARHRQQEGAELRVQQGLRLAQRAHAAIVECDDDDAADITRRLPGLHGALLRVLPMPVPWVEQARRRKGRREPQRRQRADRSPGPHATCLPCPVMPARL